MVKIQPKSDSILPKKYYTINGNTVRLNEGPYRGVSFEIGKIKIRLDILTGQPNLLYDYTIIDCASFDASFLRSDPKLSRIIAAIIVDESCVDFDSGSNLEKVEWPNQELKP